MIVNLCYVDRIEALEYKLYLIDLNALYLNRTAFKAPPAAACEKAAATYCGMSASKMKRLRLAGNGPKYFKPFGNQTVRYLTLDLDRWLVNCRNAG